MRDKIYLQDERVCRMVFQKDYFPQFREAEADGLIGLRGYMCYFQDVATAYMHDLGKGNDTLPEQYGIAWMYTKYKLEICRRADFTAPVHMECWASKVNRARAVQEAEFSRDGELYARGRLESCLFSLKDRRLCTMDEIAYPMDTALARESGTEEFVRIPKQPGQTRQKHVYTYTVVYTDLDKSGHMNNLHYVNLFMNAFSPDFYREHFIRSFELHYSSQCYFGETLEVFAGKTASGWELCAKKSDGEPAAVCIMLP